MRHIDFSDTVALVFGVISEYDPQTMRVKVSIDEDENGVSVVVTDWMPILVRRAQDDKEMFPFDTKEQVACLINWELERAFCLGALYNDKDAPNGGGKDIYKILFKDGSFEKFDRSNGKRELNYTGEYKLDANKITNTATGGAAHEIDAKHSIKNTAESLHAIMSDLLTALQEMTFTNGGGTTLFTNNIASFAAIQARIELLLTD